MIDKTWITAAPIADIPTNGYITLSLNGVSILVINNQGNYFALENRCSHEDLTLEGGELEDETIICPHHGAAFCLRTGQATCPPAYEAIKCFPLRIKEGMVEIQF